MGRLNGRNLEAMAGSDGRCDRTTIVGLGGPGDTLETGGARGAASGA